MTASCPVGPRTPARTRFIKAGPPSPIACAILAGRSMTSVAATSSDVQMSKPLALVLGRRADDDAADLDVVGLIDREGDGSGDRVRRNRDFLFLFQDRRSHVGIGD